MIKVLWKRWQLQMRIEGSDISREMSIIRVMLSYSQIGYKKLTLRNLISKKRNQRNELSIKKLRYMILKEYY